MNLVFHQAALGDFVLTWPILRALGAPTAVASTWSKAALAGRAFDHVRPVDIEMIEFTRLYAEGGPTSVSPMVGELFEQATRIISFVSRGDDAWAENVRRLAPQAEVACVPPRPPADWTRHVTAWHDACLRRQGVDLTPAPPAATGVRSGPVVVHPGSGGAEKCWPRQRFEALIRTLPRALPVLGEVERETWPDADLELWRSELAARDLRSLDELDDVLRSASAYVGNDSGPTHLAAQLGLPTTALFGPTDPARWAPQGPSVTVLAPDSPRAMDWLKVETVLAALTQGR